MQALDQIRERYNVETDTAVAEILQTSRQLVGWWRKYGRIGPRNVLLVERHSGVSRHMLRPDIYGPEPSDNHANTHAAA